MKPASKSQATPERRSPRLISADELSEMLGVSPRTVWRLLSTQKLIEPIRLGGSVRWRLDRIEEWIEHGCPPPRRRK